MAWRTLAREPGVSGRARIVQISVSPGGVPKRPAPAARVTALGLQGDGHRAHGHHGGPDRALCRFSPERIATLQAEGHPITPGSIGENHDLDYSRVSQQRHPGDGRVYARVLREGSLTNGDPVRLLTEDEARRLVGC